MTALNTSTPGAQPSNLPALVWHDITLPKGYQCGADGVFLLDEGDDGASIAVKLCSPLRVIGLYRRPDGTGWGKIIRLVDPEEREHDVLLDSADIAASAALALKRLIDRGLRLTSADAKAPVLALLQAWEPDELYTLVDHFGWVGEDTTSFMTLGGKVLGDERIVPAEALRAHPKALCSGSLEDWKTAVAARCLGNPLAMLAVSLSLSGPILRLMNFQSGGFHVRGLSSRGKSTLLGVAASVWGAPAMMGSWRTTDNALEAVAARHNDQFLALDELHQMDHRRLGAAIYMLGNGHGKGRMGLHGETKAVME